MAGGVGGAARPDADRDQGDRHSGTGGNEPGVVGWRGMIQISVQTRILVAVEAVDFRKGVDGLAPVCQERLQSDPFCGGLFAFRNRPPSGGANPRANWCDLPPVLEIAAGTLAFSPPFARG